MNDKKAKLIKLIRDGQYSTALEEIAQVLDSEPQISGPDDTISILKPYSTRQQEYFLVLTLAMNHQVLQLHEITKGLLNRTLVHPREVFRAAISDNAAAIILAHNHPSGELDPSDEDIDITKRLVKAGSILGVSVLDHVIISRKGSYSFAGHGIMPLPNNED